MMKPLQAFLHTRGIRSIFYLDDILILGSSKEECLAHLTTALTLLAQVGFIVNHKKLCLVPAQRFRFLDLDLDLDLRMGHGFRPDVYQRRQTPQPLDARLKDGSMRRPDAGIFRFSSYI